MSLETIKPAEDYTTLRRQFMSLRTLALCLQEQLRHLQDEPLVNFDWAHEDLYRSNNGAGPLTARILCATNTVVTMKRWRRSEDNAVVFKLPLRFLLSSNCGWRKVNQES